MTDRVSVPSSPVPQTPSAQTVTLTPARALELLDEPPSSPTPSPAPLALPDPEDPPLFLIGTEVEYAPLATVPASHPPLGPIAASVATVCGYLGLPIPAHSPDFAGEWSAELSTRDRLTQSPLVPALVAGYPHGLPSAFLGNGSRLYVDHAHPEYSTPECLTPIDVVHAELAGDRIVASGADSAALALSADHPGAEPYRLRIFKSNSDGKGHSWGAHENYLLPRSLSIPYITAATLGFFVTRQLFCGAGKVGAENGRPAVGFQLSQRADFFTQINSLQTTYDRGIVNTRDEPHADPALYRRLHVICGDANLAPYALWLKVSTTALVLLAASRQAFEPLADWVQLRDPVSSIHRISHDIDLEEVYPTLAGFDVTALDVAWAYHQAVSDALHSAGDFPSWAPLVLDHWADVLDSLALDPLALADRLDWAAKYRILSEAEVPFASSRASAADVIYHELGSGLAARIDASGLFTPPPGFDLDAVSAAITTAPQTRARHRADLIAAASTSSLSADPVESWTSIDWSEAIASTGETVRFPLR